MAIGWKNEYLRYRGVFLNVFEVYYARPDVKVFIEIGLSLVTITFFTIFALRPTFITIAKIYNEIKSKEETIVKMDEKIENLQTAQKILSERSEEIALVEYAIPTNPSPDKFLIQMQRLAAFNQINLGSFALSNVTLVGEPKINSASEEIAPFPPNSLEMPITLKIDGEFNAISQSIASLENFRRPIKIDKITISQDSINEGLVSVSVTGRVPYLKVKK